MGIDRVRYVGEPVAGVAADDEWIAQEALRRIVVEYLPTEPILNARQGLVDVPDPGQKVHPETKYKNNLHKEGTQPATRRVNGPSTR